MKLPDIRVLRFRQQSGRCFYCDDPMWERRFENDGLRNCAERLGIEPGSQRWRIRLRWRMCTSEHLIRRVDGGTDHPENIVAACALCNSLRADRSPDEFRELRMKGGNQRRRRRQARLKKETATCLDQTTE